MAGRKSGPIGIGIAGIGRAGWGMHCAELKGREDKFVIAAACDPEKARRDRMADRYGCAVYRRIEDMIADPRVELVDIASPSPVHVPQALLALRAGKNVFLEKPIAVSHAEARKLKTAQRKSKGKVYARHNRRFEPAFQHIRELIASGLLGDVYEIKLRRLGYQRRDDWQTLLDCGGGQLLNWGPHIVDHALRLLEAPVADQWSDLKRIAAVGDAEDHLKIVLRGRNGRIVDLEISGGAALGEPEYVVFGSRGALTCSGNEIRLRYLDPARKLKPRRAKRRSPPMDGGFGAPDTLQWKEETVPVNPGVKCSMDGIWDHLYAAIRKGKPFPITLDEAIDVMAVISRARKGTAFANP
jgi:predicted dehydrogenase